MSLKIVLSRPATWALGLTATVTATQQSAPSARMPLTSTAARSLDRLRRPAQPF